MTTETTELKTTDEGYAEALGAIKQYRIMAKPATFKKIAADLNAVGYRNKRGSKWIDWSIGSVRNAWLKMPESAKPEKKEGEPGGHCSQPALETDPEAPEPADLDDIERDFVCRTMFGSERAVCAVSPSHAAEIFRREVDLPVDKPVQVEAKDGADSTLWYGDGWVSDKNLHEDRGGPVHRFTCRSGDLPPMTVFELDAFAAALRYAREMNTPAGRGVGVKGYGIKAGDTNWIGGAELDKARKGDAKPERSPDEIVDQLVAKQTGGETKPLISNAEIVKKLAELCGKVDGIQAVIVKGEGMIPREGFSYDVSDAKPSLVKIGSIQDARPRDWKHDLSPSRIRTLEECELRWAKKYLDKEPEPIVPIFEIGKLVHRTLEHAFKERIRAFGTTNDPKHLDEEFTLEELSNVLTEHAQPPFKPKWMKEALGVLKTIAPHLSASHAAMIEETIPLAIKVDGEDVSVGQILDRVDFRENRVVIYDYKLGFGFYSLEDVRSWIQVGCILTAAKEKWPDKEIELVVWFLARNIPMRIFWTQEIDDWTRVAIEVAARRIRQLQKGHALKTEEGYERGPEKLYQVPLPTISGNCKTCAYRDSCDAYHEAIDARQVPPFIPADMSSEDILRLREKVSAVAKIADERRKEIDALCRETLDAGNVKLDGRTFYLKKGGRSASYRSVAPVVRLVAEATGASSESVRNAICDVSASKLGAFLARADEETVRRVEEGLASMADTHVRNPSVCSRKSREKKKASE